MAYVPPFDSQQLTAIAKALAPTADGLSGPEIGHLLAQCSVPDVDPNLTKWKRLFNAFALFQNEKNFGNHVVKFINLAMNPVQFTGEPDKFRRWRDRLNVILAFSGMAISEKGQVVAVRAAANLDEAMARADRLRYLLENRSVHAEVLRYCKAELLQKNYFHAVFEATKSVASKVRLLTGHAGDGAALVQFALGGTNPPVAINDLQTESDQSEQAGFMNLVTGLFGAVRNPLAHKAKVEWEMNEQDALDILTLISFIHRKLDQRRRP